MSLKQSKITDCFYKLEKDSSLFEKKTNDVFFWERVRFIVHRKILIQKKIIKKPHESVSFSFNDVFNLTISVIKSITLKNPFLSKKKEIICIGHPRRKLQDNNKYWDLYCDPIINKIFQDNYLLLERSHQGKHLHPQKTTNIKYLDFISVFSTLISKIKKVKLERKDVKYLKSIDEKIHKQFGVQINLPKIVKTYLTRRKIELFFYTSLLKKLSPRVLLVVVSYRMNQIIIEAAKNLGITAVELQHGLIYKYHVGYNYPPINKNLKGLPDYFLIFGDFWKKKISFPINPQNIISVGFPYLELQKNKYGDSLSEKQIIFISQGSIGDKLSRVAVKLSKTNQIKRKIIYKLHPGEYKGWKNKYPWLLNSGIEVIDSSCPPLYKLLSESEVLIGVSSTSIYEGIALGVKKTILLNLPGVEFMKELINRGYAYKANDISEIIKIISETKACKNNERLAQNDKSTIFFKSNPIKNIESFFKNFLGLDVKA